MFFMEYCPPFWANPYHSSPIRSKSSHKTAQQTPDCFNVSLMCINLLDVQIYSSSINVPNNHLQMLVYYTKNKCNKFSLLH